MKQVIQLTHFQLNDTVLMMGTFFRLRCLFSSTHTHVYMHCCALEWCFKLLIREMVECVFCEGKTALQTFQAFKILTPSPRHGRHIQDFFRQFCFFLSSITATRFQWYNMNRIKSSLILLLYQLLFHGNFCCCLILHDCRDMREVVSDTLFDGRAYIVNRVP